ncbi:MAG: type II toxin-antitoxin system YafQ family toxin [Epsilonproteobacteria bacterium]|nr:type II toxin-antitoxin system YafQ family toxin [Campylobacterota bacterium]
MLIAIYQKQFTKDIQRQKKRSKDMSKIRQIMQALLESKKLPVKNRNHKLKGPYSTYWECHIEPDWLLIYKKTDTEIIFIRTGTHADLF